MSTAITQAGASAAEQFGPGTGRTGRSASEPRSFDAILGARRQHLTPEAGARDAAEQFVAQALVEPILARFRASGDAVPPFAPGDSEKAFRPLLDAQIAQRIVRSQNFPIVEAVARRLLEHQRSADALPDSPGPASSPATSGPTP